ncbi:MAG: DUF3185 domain-containing protein [Vicinamibacterales bacterium]
MKVLGLILVVLGLTGLVWGGVSWTHDDTVVDAGPIEVTTEKTEHLPLPPVAGGLLLVAGVVLVVRAR